MLSLAAVLACSCVFGAAAEPPLPAWKHLSSKNGDLPAPNGGPQQTACVVFDIDRDGAADIVLAERTQTPAVIWLRHTRTGWDKYVIDDTQPHPEAGGCAYDADGDGDRDLILGSGLTIVPPRSLRLCVKSLLSYGLFDSCPEVPTDEQLA